MHKISVYRCKYIAFFHYKPHLFCNILQKVKLKVMFVYHIYAVDSFYSFFVSFSEYSE